MARIVAVADAFDAMISPRPYRAPLSPEKAFAEIWDKAGIQFDPECVQAFLRLRPRIEDSVGRGPEAAGETVPRDDFLRTLNTPPAARAPSRSLRVPS